MPDVRRCAIYGCRSNSRDDRELKFFNFPARENPLYEIWLAICKESDNSIRSQRKPYICSKHFLQKDVGFRRLAMGAVPALYLEAPPGFAEEEAAREAEEAAIKAEKQRKIKLVNDTVLEWSRRAQHYPDTVAECRSRRELRKVATRARNLIGATLEFYVDDYWLRKFRRSHMVDIDEMDLDETRNKTLDIASIIYDLDPSVHLVSEEEIAVLSKEEEVQQMIQTQLNAEQRAERKRLQQAKLEGRGGNKNVKVRRTFYDSINSYYDANESKYDYSDGYNEFKSEENDSVDLSQEEVYSYDLDDDDEDIVRVEDNLEEPRSSELVINSYKQALEHLKPLEDFVLRQANYRAIGLLSTLEIIFKNPINI